MKSNAYVSIDAHVVRCRLHHKNNHKYSVAFKSGKQQQVCTDYKPSKDLIIEMDTHLSLQADKYTYDNFPKLTLIVNVMGQANEKKSVGTTFANFKKEGVQIFQVSQCSCKDKAFQVEVVFTLKMVQGKNSKASNNKNLISQDKKMNYFSHQPTPRESREVKLERFSKPLKDNIKTESEQKMSRINSQKVIVHRRQQIKQGGNKQNQVQVLVRQIEALNCQMKIQEQRLKQRQSLQIQIQQCKQRNQLLQQLLVLQQEKSEESAKYILFLEHSILGLTSKDHPLRRGESITSFKVIEEKDEFIEINEQLQGELQIQRQKNNMLYLQIDQLNRQLKQLRYKYQQKNRISQISIHSNKNEVALQTDHQIPLLSVCKSNKESSVIYKQKEKLEQLKLELKLFLQKIGAIKAQIQKLQIIKKQLQTEITKLKPAPFNKKKSPAKPQVIKKQEQTRKIEKATSSDKNWKPPKKSSKKVIQSPSSNIQISTKKSIGANSVNSADLKENGTKIVSTQIETKTERQQSMEDFQSNQQGSLKKQTIYNQIVYFTDGLDN